MIRRLQLARDTEGSAKDRWRREANGKHGPDLIKRQATRYGVVVRRAKPQDYETFDVHLTGSSEP